MLTKVCSVTLHSSYPLRMPALRSHSAPAEDIIIDTDDLLDGTSLIVPQHCCPPFEPTASRYVKNLSKIVGDVTDILPTEPCSRNSPQDLPDIANVGSYHREIARQGLFDRGWRAFPIRAEKHRVGRAVVPWHF